MKAKANMGLFEENKQVASDKYLVASSKTSAIVEDLGDAEYDTSRAFERQTTE